MAPVTHHARSEVSGVDQPEEDVVSRGWMWAVVVLSVLLVAVAIALVVVVTSGDDVTTPGPQGAVGPQAPVGQQAPAGPQGQTLEGSGVLVTEARPVSPFEELTLSGVADVVVVTGEATSVEVEGDDNIVPLISTTIDDQELTIGLTIDDTALEPVNDIIVRVTTPGLSRIEHIGVGRVSVDAVDAGELAITFIGVGGVDVANLAAENLAVEASGVGTITLGGRVANQTVLLDDTTDYDGADLASDTTSMQHDGLGAAVLWVERVLDVEIRDMGSVSYYGDPAVSPRITGQGSLIPLGDR